MDWFLAAREAAEAVGLAGVAYWLGRRARQLDQRISRLVSRTDRLYLDVKERVEDHLRSTMHGR